MENSIIRGAIQGLIDDSKLVDKIANKLGCNRVEILDKVDDNFALESEPIATIDEIKEVIHAVQRAETSISDARYSSEEAKDQADNSISECDNADTYIGDAGNITNVWETKIRELEAVKVEADTEVTEEQKEINNSNQYETINN